MTTASRSGLVAVLFTDLVGSTELMSQLGERPFDEVRRQHFAALTKVVAAHGGEEVKTTGDGILAVFPSAGEAVEAAVAMQQTTVRQKSSVPLSMRVGVAVGDATLEDGDVFGAPVVEAARLVGAAEAGQILATGIVQALAARAEASFEDLGTLEFKGLPEPVAACQVVWEPLPVSSVPLPALLSEMGRVFVGRDDKLERLGQLWKKAVAGERRVALLAGEPGIGKTRLAAVAARQSYDEGGVVLAGRCDEDLGVPYQPFVEALRHYVTHASDPRLGRHPGELVRLVPEVADSVRDLAPPLRSDPETERYRLFDAVAAWLAEVSQEAPVLLVLDDLQWAAKPTLLLLRHVLRSPEAMSLLVMATYRDSDVGRGHPLVEFLADLRGEAGVERLTLTGLDAAGVADFLVQAAGHDLDESGAELARAVWRETEGSPFFVGEVLRHLAESGAVEERDGRWVVTGRLDELGIPEGVRDVVGRRLTRLSDDANRVLHCASVAGLEFEPAVIQIAGGFDEDTVLSVLEEAVAARLVVELPGPVPRNRFAHALVRATLYDELSVARRGVLHGRVAEAIENVHPTALQDYLAALAHHWARGSANAAATGKALEYAARAGHHALAQLAYDEAAAWFGQAVDLLDQADEGRRCDLLTSLGDAQRCAGDPAHRQTLLDAARAAHGLGDRERLAHAALANHRGLFASAAGVVDQDRVDVLEAALDLTPADDTPTRARLLAALAHELMFGLDWSRRVRLSDEALAIARRSGDLATLAQVLLERFHAIWAPATLVDRTADTIELLALAEQLGDPATVIRAAFLRFRTAMEAGDIPEADRYLEIAERESAELGQPTLRWQLGLQRTGRMLTAGRIEEAERLAAATYELGRAAGQPDAAAFLVFQQSCIRFEQGRLGAVEQQLTETIGAVPGLSGLRAFLALVCCELDRPADGRVHFEALATDEFTSLPVDLLWLPYVAFCAMVCTHLGDQPRARILTGRLAPYRDYFVYTSAGSFGGVTHHLGHLATTLEHYDEAEVHFADAAATHGRIGAPTWLARTRLEWARMLLTRRGTGDADRARELLGQALATARELGLANVERRAVALLS